MKLTGAILFLYFVFVPEFSPIGSVSAKPVANATEEKGKIIALEGSVALQPVQNAAAIVDKSAVDEGKKSAVLAESSAAKVEEKTPAVPGVASQPSLIPTAQDNDGLETRAIPSLSSEPAQKIKSGSVPVGAADVVVPKVAPVPAEDPDVLVARVAPKPIEDPDVLVARGLLNTQNVSVTEGTVLNASPTQNNGGEAAKVANGSIPQTIDGSSLVKNSAGKGSAVPQSEAATEKIDQEGGIEKSFLGKTAPIVPAAEKTLASITPVVSNKSQPEGKMVKKIVNVADNVTNAGVNMIQKLQSSSNTSYLQNPLEKTTSPGLPMTDGLTHANGIGTVKNENILGQSYGNLDNFFSKKGGKINMSAQLEIPQIPFLSR